MTTVIMRDLLEAGVHFGHQTRRWNPKMRPYIFTERNGIYIIDLQRTLREIQATYEFARNVAARGGHLLFVGTKKQAQEAVEREARRCNMPYVNQRWLGGMLTNWTTMKTRIARLEELEAMRENGAYDALPKKEVLKLEAEREKLDRNLSGIRDMDALPEAVFVIDTRREMIPISEARKLRIPLIGLVDTNADPDEVDYVIPANDDAIRSVALMCRILADACVEGRLAAGLPVDSEPAEPKPPAGPAVVPAAALVADQPADDADAPQADDASAEEASADEASTEKADDTPAEIEDLAQAEPDGADQEVAPDDGNDAGNDGEEED